jgi:predicted AlkP superfamily phosphohydrolase/phosphomutase
VVLDIIRTQDIYAGDALDALPDLLLEWNKASPITSVRSPKIGVVEGMYRGPRTGDHRPSGFVFVRGPSVEPGPVRHPVAVTDLAPTIAAHLGVTLPDVDGRPVDELLGDVPSV